MADWRILVLGTHRLSFLWEYFGSHLDTPPTPHLLSQPHQTPYTDKGVGKMANISQNKGLSYEILLCSSGDVMAAMPLSHTQVRSKLVGDSHVKLYSCMSRLGQRIDVVLLACGITVVFTLSLNFFWAKMAICGAFFKTVLELTVEEELGPWGYLMRHDPINHGTIQQSFLDLSVGVGH
ncbi:hypothetical protein EDD18DRAFT_1108182 [Armillaria luteobubalina]|uniref:Uncharacterized protein n=1 Tax=Armillaria luteobubalina TaxID=153913 RepID=A0AA39Q1A0_9AGAR|nr:hypothetical protein EDD18DRAFT_1108182 [Armillaria luteobubalina]